MSNRCLICGRVRAFASDRFVLLRKTIVLDTSGLSFGSAQPGMKATPSPMTRSKNTIPILEARVANRQFDLIDDPVTYAVPAWPNSYCAKGGSSTFAYIEAPTQAASIVRSTRTSEPQRRARRVGTYGLDAMDHRPTD